MKKLKRIFEYLFLYIKYIGFFLYTKKDFKMDFPFPPKPFYRIFKPIFWIRFFPHYYRRKKSQLKYSYNIAEYWKKEQWEQDDYLTWLQKVFQKQYPRVASNEIFFRICKTEPQNILEVGAGSGHSAACFLSYYLNHQFKKNQDFQKIKKINFTGIDLSFLRIKFANIYLPIFLNKHIEFIKLNFVSGDATKMKYMDKQFDFTLVPSVLERVDDENIEDLVKEMCRVTKKGVFVSDFYDQMPDGFPRSPKILSKLFSKHGFNLTYDKINYVKIPRKENAELHCFFERDET